MQLAFTGDFYVPHSMATLPAIGPDLQRLLHGCTGVMVNFEAPLDPGSASKAAFKTGPALRQHPGAMQHLVQAGVMAVGLANNHAADFGTGALQATADAADALGVQIAGLWQSGAARFAEWRQDDLVVRVLAFAEEEWSGDARADTRVAVLDLTEAARQIAEAKRQADAVFVTLHGNNEHSPLPNPAFARTARFLVDCGSDGVIVHHAHRISGVETYQGRPILFGLGNFQFCTPAKNAHWHEGLVATLTVARTADGLTVTPQLHAVDVQPGSYTVDLAGPDRAAKLLNDVAALSQTIASEPALEAHFADFVAQNARMYNEFLNPYAGAGRAGRIFGRLWVRRVFLRKKRHAMLINALRCDSHRVAMTRHLLNQFEK